MRIFRNYIRGEMFAVMMYAVVLFGCGYFIVIVFPSIQKIKALKDYLEALPPFMRGFFGQEALEFTKLEGFLCIEFLNTTWVFVTGVFSALFAGAMIAEEVEKKRLEILLSTQLSRHRLVLEKFLGFVACLLIVNIFSYLGIMAGALQIGEKADYMLYGRVYVSGTLCMICVGAIALFVSCAVREQRRAVSISLAFFIALYFFNIIAALLEQYPILSYLSLFHYFDASKIIKREAILWGDMSVLIVVAAILFVASIIHFQRQEIHV